MAQHPLSEFLTLLKNGITRAQRVKAPDTDEELASIKAELQDIKTNGIPLSGSKVEVIKSFEDELIAGAATARFGVRRSDQTETLPINGYDEVIIRIENRGTEECRLWTVSTFVLGNVRYTDAKLMYSENNSGTRWSIPAGSRLLLSKSEVPALGLGAGGIVLTFYDSSNSTYSTLIDIDILGVRR